ncbi:MAG: SDR family NAD(P)-dependent oxidoreductase [Anaerolineae bacterium]
MNVSGRVAIVTGAASGIGAGIARSLARAGAAVAVADLNVAGAETVADELRAEGRTAIGVAVNVAEADSVDAMVERVVAELGRLDILVNSAGIIADEVDVSDMSDQVWDRILNVNLRSQFLCCRAAIRVMKPHGYGRIVNIASRSWLGGAGLANYAASKGGVISLTRSLAMEVGKYGITVNCVSPTLIVTPLFLGMPQEEQERDLARARTQPIPRLGQPEDVAYAVLCFAGEGASFITGQNLYVGGGGDLRTAAL